MSYRTRNSTSLYNSDLKNHLNNISDTSSIKTEKTEILFSSDVAATSIFASNSKKGTSNQTPNEFEDCPTIAKEANKTDFNRLNGGIDIRATINKRRQKLKLKAQNTFDSTEKNSTSTFQKFRLLKKNTDFLADDYDRKRKIAETINELDRKVYNPIKKDLKQREKNQTAGKIRLFDFKKKFIFEFRLFEEKDLGFEEHLKKFIIDTKVDNDAETDEETLKYYVKKCCNDLKESIKLELAEKMNK